LRIIIPNSFKRFGPPVGEKFVVTCRWEEDRLQLFIFLFDLFSLRIDFKRLVIEVHSCLQVRHRLKRYLNCSFLFLKNKLFLPCLTVLVVVMLIDWLGKVWILKWNSLVSKILYSVSATCADLVKIASKNSLRIGMQEFLRVKTKIESRVRFWHLWSLGTCRSHSSLRLSFNDGRLRINNRVLDFRRFLEFNLGFGHGGLNKIVFALLLWSHSPVVTCLSAWSHNFGCLRLVESWIFEESLITWLEILWVKWEEYIILSFLHEFFKFLFVHVSSHFAGSDFLFFPEMFFCGYSWHLNKIN